MKKLFFLPLFITLGNSWCYSQNDVFRHPAPNDEVTPFIVNSIVEDSDGFIWIGGSNGLLKFDGVTTEYFQHHYNDPHSLVSNSVNTLFIDKRGNLWIGTSEGLCKYDPSSKAFQNIIAPGVHSLNVRNIGEDIQNRIWVGLDGSGLAALTQMPAKQKESSPQYHFIFFRHDEKNSHSLSNDQVWAIYFDEKNRGWIGTSDGLNVFDANQSPENIQFTVYTHLSSQINSLATSDIWRIYPDNKHSLWLLNLKGQMLDRVDLDKYEKTNLPVTHYYQRIASLTGQPAISFYDVTVSTDRFIWVFSNGNGLYRLNEDSFLDEKISRPVTDNFTEDAAKNNSLPSNYLFCGFADKNNVLWIGSDKGAVYYHPSFALFAKSFFQNNYSYLENREFAAALNGNHNTLWLADTFDLYVCKGDVIRPIKIKDLAGTPDDAEIMSVAESNDGTVYLGTDMGIATFTPGEITKYLQLSSYMPQVTWISYKSGKNEDDILNLVTDKHNRLWIGFADGLKMYDPVTGRMKNIFTKTSQNPNRSYIVRSLFLDDRLWLGTDGGLFDLDPDSPSIIHEVNTPELHQLKITQTNCIVRSNKDEYWIGTNLGLFVWNRKNDQTTFFNHQNGLIGDQVNALHEDLKGNMWIATPRGFSEFDDEKKSVQNFTASDGLRSTDFVSQVDFRDSSGNLFFGTATGSIFFDPDRTAGIHFNPPVYVTDFKIFDQSIFENNTQLREEFVSGKTIELSHSQNFFTFDFTAVDFLNTSHILYRYKLEGVDQNWVFAGSQRTANYTKIAPGTYTFFIKAGNDEMGWKSAKPVQLTIAPPWWETWWFRALIVLLVVVAILAIYKIRVDAIRRQERHKTEINRKMNELEMTALRAQMNPHFIFNCMNSIQNYILKNETRLAVKYLNQFASLIRMILDNSKNKTVLLTDELTMLESYVKLEQLRLDHQFQYEIHLGKDVFPEELQIPTMLLQPFIENAIWHGFRQKEEKAVLQLHFEKRDDFLNIAIEDNGVGREKSIREKSAMQHTHQSKGILITKERIATLNELYDIETSFRIIDLKDKQGIAAGTRVELRIPIRNMVEAQS